MSESFYGVLIFLGVVGLVVFLVNKYDKYEGPYEDDM